MTLQTRSRPIDTVRYIAIIALCVAATCCDGVRAERQGQLQLRLGTEHVGERDDYVNGWVIWHTLEQDNVYSISRSKTKGQDILWLERLLYRNEEGSVMRTVNFLVLPAIGVNQHLARGGCSVNKVRDPTIFALIFAPEGVSSAIVTSAWRVNEKSETFHSITTDHIFCDPTRWGGESG